MGFAHLRHSTLGLFAALGAIGAVAASGAMAIEATPGTPPPSPKAAKQRATPTWRMGFRVPRYPAATRMQRHTGAGPGNMHRAWKRRRAAGRAK